MSISMATTQKQMASKVSTPSPHLQEIALPDFINLGDPEVLKNFLAKECQSKLHVVQATALANTLYETAPEKVSLEFGSDFPMNPEILAYCMKMAKDQNVLELAGAYGQNSALLAFAGAKHVYMNELNTCVGETLEHIKKKIPKNVGQKLTYIRGSCFDIPTNNPELCTNIDVLLCRNFIHFLNKKEQSAFFDLLKKLLKPGKQAIITANAIYSRDEAEHFFKEHPEATCAKVVQCVILDSSQKTPSCKPIYYQLSPRSLEDFSTEFQGFNLYTREPGASWKANQEDFNRLDQETKAIMKKVIQEHKLDFAPIKNGKVRVLSSDVGMYSEKTLSDLVQAHGFDVMKSFTTDSKGHLIPSNMNHSKMGQQVGVIIKKPQKQ